MIEEYKARLKIVNEMLTAAYIDGLLWIIGISTGLGIVMFGYLIKNMFILKTIVIIALLLGSGLLCIKFIKYPQTRPVTLESKNSKKNNLLGTITESLPDVTQYDKDLEKAMKF